MTESARSMPLIATQLLAAPAGPLRGSLPTGRSSAHPRARCPRSRRQHLSSVSSGPARRRQQRAEVDPRVRVVAVERRVDLARALAADQRPVGGLRRPGVEEVDRRVELQPRAPAREQVVAPAPVASSRRSIGTKSSSIGGRSSSYSSTVRAMSTQLRRMRRHDLHDPDPHRRGRVDEVHVLEAPLDHGHELVALAPPARAASRCPCRRSRSRTNATSSGAGEQPRVLDPDEDLVAVLALELHERPLAHRRRRR